MVVHGMVCGINWQLNGPLPDSQWTKVTADMLHLAVGNTALEAFGAMLSEDSSVIPREILEAVNTIGGLDKLDAIDSQQKLAQDTHQSWFGSQSGGTFWKIVKNAKKDENPINDPQISSANLEGLRNLNETQMLFDKARRELESSQWEFYSLWWKRGCAIENFELNDQWPKGLDQGDPLTKFNSELKRLQGVVEHKNKHFTDLKIKLLGGKTVGGDVGWIKREY